MSISHKIPARLNLHSCKNLKSHNNSNVNVHVSSDSPKFISAMYPKIFPNLQTFITSKSLMYLLIFNYSMSLDKCGGHWILINFSLNHTSDKKGKEMKMTAITYYDC